MVISFVITSCSFKKMAIESVADSLSTAGGSIVFTGEDDPQLVKDALPVLMKSLEALLDQTPNNPALCLTTGQIFVMYANAFVHTPASMLSDDDFELKDSQFRRAKKLYLRGYKYILRGIELKYPGMTSKLKKDASLSVLSGVQQEDTAYLYWAVAGWMGAYSTNALDFEVGVGVPIVLVMMNKALELNPAFGKGSIHSFYISYYGSLPVALGGGEEKARYHFKKALEYSNGLSVSAYVSLAASVAVKKQDVDEYTELLNKALTIDVDQDPANRLVNIIMQDKAKWLLDHKGDKFLLENEKGEEE